jgi:hypothetical protein
VQPRRRRLARQHDRDLQIIGAVDLGNVTRGGRETVDRIRIGSRTVLADVVNVGQKDDGACCGSASALVRLKWNPSLKRVVVASQKRYTEVPVVKRLLAAVRSGRRGVALSLATPAVVRDLWRTRGAGVRLSRCHGVLDFDIDWWKADDSTWLRACTINITRPGGEQAWTLHVDRSGRHG